MPAMQKCYILNFVATCAFMNHLIYVAMSGFGIHIRQISGAHVTTIFILWNDTKQSKNPLDKHFIIM